VATQPLDKGTREPAPVATDAYHGRMLWGAVRRAPETRPLLPGSLRPAGIALLGTCVAVVAVPAAVGLTEYVLKPYVGGPLGQAFPSGHATSSFALAAIWAILLADPPYRHLPRTLRLLLVLMALLLATAVAAALIAIGAHTFTDAVAGAAVGTGVVLACALTLDLVSSRVLGVPAGRSVPAGRPAP
jgi:membrane-associated phospholipid phosphatase